MLKKNLVGIFELFYRIVFSLPRIPICDKIKSLFLAIFGAKVGPRTTYYPYVWINSGKNLSVGSDVDFATGCVVTTDGGVIIGDRVLIGYGAKILSRNHVIPKDDSQIFYSGHVSKPVCIHNDVWIGAQAIILPGVTIGEGSVIAAGAVVTKSIPSFSIVAGVPAKIISSRI